MAHATSTDSIGYGGVNNFNTEIGILLVHGGHGYRLHHGYFCSTQIGQHAMCSEIHLGRETHPLTRPYDVFGLLLFLGLVSWD